MEDNSCYKRTQGADGGVGTRYETKMTAFTLLRLYNSTEEFQLANNFKDGGKFDDLVFSFKQSDVWYTWFVQLKHKTNANEIKKKISVSSLRSKNKNQDFYLAKYYESYKLIKGRFLGNDEKSNIFKNNFEHVTFVIFTNAKLDEVMLKRQRYKCTSLLSTGSPSEYNFRFTGDSDSDIYDALSGFEKFDFLEKLLLCTSQVDEDLMDNLLEQEIRKKHDLTPTEVKYVVSRLYQYIQRWYTEGSYLSKSQVKLILAESSLETISNKMSDFNVRFIPGFLRSFARLKEESNMIALISKLESTLLSRAALKQGIQSRCPVYINLGELNKQQMKDDILSQWLTGEEKFLVVDCEVNVIEVDVPEMSAFLMKLASANKRNFVILIMTSKNQVANNMAQNVNAKKVTFNCSLRDLSEESRNLIVDRDIRFQGYLVKLSTLLSGTSILNDVFNMSMLTPLLQGREVEVGVKPVERIDYYVTRMLLRKTTLHVRVLKAKEKPGLLAVTEITESELRTIMQPHDALALSSTVLKLGRIPDDIHVILLDGENFAEDFAKLCGLISTGSIHLLSRYKKSWKWKSSFGPDINRLTPFVNEKLLDYLPTDNEMKIKDKLVLIVAEPGMGKSTLITHMAAQTKRLCPKMWVILLTLNDYTRWFDQEEFTGMDENQVKELLKQAAGISPETSKFDARLFEHCYSTSGNMIVLMDGFDEISSCYSDVVCNMLSVLKRSRISRIWITTRPAMGQLLQSRLSTFAFTIKPFETKDQVAFFEKFWLQQCPVVTEAEVKCFTNDLLNLVKKSFGEEATEFTGIPLQTRMLAEAFAGNLKEYHDTGRKSLPDRINLLDLFDKFVDTKFKIFLNDKCQLDATNASARSFRNEMTKNREMELMKMAVYALLPASVRSKLSPKITTEDMLDLHDKVDNGLHNMGIVDRFEGEVAHFVHRTFAEYFTARYLFEFRNLNGTFLQSEEFFSPSMSLIKHMLDRMLSRKALLHNAVLDGDVDLFSSLLASGTGIDELDLGGRTALHVAAGSEKSHHLVRECLKAGANVNVTDRVLHWTPLKYALRLRNLHHVGAILEHPQCLAAGAEVEVKTWEVWGTWEALRMIIQQDYIQLYRLAALDENAFTANHVLPPRPWLGQDSDDFGLTLLHLAAAYGASKILKYQLFPEQTESSLLPFINYPDHKQMTPLHYAVHAGNSDSVQILLDHGSNVSLENDSKKNSLTVAIELKNKKIMTLFLCHQMKTSDDPEKLLKEPLTLLVAQREESCLSDLEGILSAFPRLRDLKTKTGIPLIAYAAAKGNVAALRVLIDLKADVNATNNVGYTALHYAVKNGFLEVAKALLAVPGIDIEARAAGGVTPLYVAVAHAQPELVDLLVKSGADVNVMNDGGDNLFHAIVCPRPNPLVFQKLMFLNVDFNCENKQGLSALSKMNHLAASPEIANIRLHLESINRKCPIPYVPLGNTLNESNAKNRRKKCKNKVESKEGPQRVQNADCKVEEGLSQLSLKNGLQAPKKINPTCPVPAESLKTKKKRGKELQSEKKKSKGSKAYAKVETKVHEDNDEVKDEAAKFKSGNSSRRKGNRGGNKTHVEMEKIQVENEG